MDSQKLRVYETLHSLNQDFERVLTDLKSFQEFPFLSRDFLRHFQIVIEEIRSCANFEIADVMHSREQHDWARYGRLRQRWEKRYADPNDVLIEAEKRKRESRKAAAQAPGQTCLIGGALLGLGDVQSCGIADAVAGYLNRRNRHTDRNCRWHYTRGCRLKAAIYARVSTADQHNAIQVRELTEYVQRREWELAGVHLDQISGAKASRPGLDKLMADARQRRFDVVLVWKLDRF